MVLTGQLRMKMAMGLFLAVAASIGGARSAAAADDRQALEAQAKRYWAAEVAQDYGTVYDLLTPGEQDTKPRDEYVTFRKVEGPFHYVTAKVGEIAVARDVGWVHVNFEWTMPSFPGARPRPSEMWIVWRYLDGWHPIPVDDREQWPLLPPHLRPAADEAWERTRSL